MVCDNTLHLFQYILFYKLAIIFYTNYNSKIDVDRLNLLDNFTAYLWQKEKRSVHVK